MFMEIPVNANVFCRDGLAGTSTDVVVKSDNNQVMHVVVRDKQSPHQEYLVDFALIRDTGAETIILDCTQDELRQFEPFRKTDYVQLEHEYLQELAMIQTTGIGWSRPLSETMRGYHPVKRARIPAGEVAIHQGHRVKATDGYIGEVAELLVNPGTQMVTHLVLREANWFRERFVTIPIEDIDWSDDRTVYLKINRREVATLPLMTHR